MRFIKAAVLLACWIPSLGWSADTQQAVAAVNPFGLDLCRRLSKRGGNVIVSPFSLQNGLVMAYAGAAGETRTEMAKVLYFPEDQNAVLESFAELNNTLSKPALVSVLMANRLFVDNGITLNPSYLDPLEKVFRVPMTIVDLQKVETAKLINDWVGAETKGRIREMLPAAGFDEQTRILLVNALYLKGPWAAPFDPKETQPRPFYSGPNVSKVPMMRRQVPGGYWKTPEFTAVGIPLAAKDLQMLVLLPPSPSGLPGLEALLTPEVLAKCTAMEERLLLLSLPKFQVNQPTLTIGAMLMEMGMKGAFDMPPGSANFEGMAERRPENYPFLSNVYHQAFFASEEAGVEVAAATAAAAGGFGEAPTPTPPPLVAVNVDRPFFFAIQHKPSGVCLLMGRIEKL